MLSKRDIDAVSNWNTLRFCGCCFCLSCEKKLSKKRMTVFILRTSFLSEIDKGHRISMWYHNPSISLLLVLIYLFVRRSGFRGLRQFLRLTLRHSFSFHFTPWARGKLDIVSAIRRGKFYDSDFFGVFCGNLLYSPGTKVCAEGYNATACIILVLYNSASNPCH